MRKGISPLISAVLLIAFTMGVAGLFSQWAPQLMEESQEESTNTSGELRSCSKVAFDITEGDGTSVTVQQIKGERAAGNLSATWFYTDGSITQGYGEMSSPRDTITISSGSSVSIDEIKVQSLECQGAPTIVHE